MVVLNRNPALAVDPWTVQPGAGRIVIPSGATTSSFSVGGSAMGCGSAASS